MPKDTTNVGDPTASLERLQGYDAKTLARQTDLARRAPALADRSPFGTHQGVKGREFDRVMVLMADGEARGFMFGFEKLLGAKEPSPGDRKNQGEGRETSIDRTRRLLYVTSSRARRSLALVAYSADPQAVKANLERIGWFAPEEIVLQLPPDGEGAL